MVSPLRFASEDGSVGVFLTTCVRISALHDIMSKATVELVRTGISEKR